MRFNIKNRSKQTVLPLKIQLSRGKGWDPINQFNSTTSLCRFQTRTMISNLVCCGIYFVFSEGRWDVIVAFVDIGLIVDHHFLNFLFIMIASIGFAEHYTGFSPIILGRARIAHIRTSGYFCVLFNWCILCTSLD